MVLLAACVIVFLVVIVPIFSPLIVCLFLVNWIMSGRPIALEEIRREVSLRSYYTSRRITPVDVANKALQKELQKRKGSNRDAV